MNLCLQVEPGRGSELLPSSDWEWINKAARFILGDNKVIPIISSGIGNFGSPYSLISASPKMFELSEQLLPLLKGSFKLFLRNFSSDCQRCSQMTNPPIITMDITACLVFSSTWKRAIIFAECLPCKAQTYLVVALFFLSDSKKLSLWPSFFYIS